MPPVENLIVLDQYWKDDEKHCGSDWKGNEVLKGDEVIHDPGLDEIIMKEDLVDYLKEKYGFEEIVAE
ncbi:YqaI family protein [Bacillus sp. FSL K6-3431]|uniref:YqaI family protein n=1 Tax=Bacillus sp. FSL K6-3431 TaxID=2921500 RepID=UPI0030FBABDD